MRRVLVAAALCLLAGPAAGQEVRLRGGVEVEGRGFWSPPALPSQTRHDASFALNGTFALTWARGEHVLTFEPFLRVDAADGNRTHADVRVLSYDRAWRSLELRLGVRRVFWGVTESRHVVDVLNQTDLVENLDGEDKLGQPMVNVAWVSDGGSFDAYLLTGFRQPTFPGEEGRLRAPLIVDPERAVFADDGAARHLAWAARWTRILGPVDVALSHFNGLSREPRFSLDSVTATRLIPVYDRIHQTGLDAQLTAGNWAWKLEAMSRSGGPVDRVWAMTGGFEYTLYQLLGSSADLGLLGEVLLDTRDHVPFNDDLFVGTRLAFNDVAGTQLLAGAMVDRATGGTLINIELGRRFGSVWSLDAEVRGFIGHKADDPLSVFRNDDYAGVRITRWF